jgi:hypothetical protein
MNKAKYPLLVLAISTACALTGAAVFAQDFGLLAPTGNKPSSLPAGEEAAGDGRQVAQSPAAMPPAHPHPTPGLPFTQPHSALPEPAGTISSEASIVSGGTVTVKVKVPHNKRVYDRFQIFPYPVKPPKKEKETELIPEDPRILRDMLLSIGYSLRSAGHKPYPSGGWRWQYAYNAALRKTGEGVPHFLYQIYPWCDRMQKAVLPEVQRMNAAETARSKNYKKAVEEYENTYSEIENEATRKGLYPLEFKMRGLGVGSVHVPAGTWWVAGYHRAAGITYYWYSPITVRDGGKSAYELTEGNALLIQGAW